MSLIGGIISWLNSRRERKNAERLQRRENEELLKRRKKKEEKEKQFLYRLGNRFEDYVISMFDPEKFDLIHRTPTNEDTRGRYVDSMRLPDLRFKEHSTGRKFWVECKFRATTEDLGNVTWCTDNQLRNYKRTHYKYRETVFIMMGLRGAATKPDKVFCLNLERINFTRLFYSTYCTNQVKMEKIESYEQLLKISELK